MFNIFIKKDDRSGVTDSIKFAGHIVTTLNSNGKNYKEHEALIKAGISGKIGMESECFVVSRANHRFDARNNLSDQLCDTYLYPEDGYNQV